MEQEKNYWDLQERIRLLQKQAALTLSELVPVFEDLFEDIPINVHYRIKSRDSVLKKCERKGKNPEDLTDILGIRLVGKTGQFVNILRKVFGKFNVKEIEDFWYHTTDLGYRSLHVLLDVEGFTVEVQIHTAVSSAFALLCHDYYKGKDVGGKFREALSLVRERLEREAKGVNGNHKALIECTHYRSKKEDFFD